MTDINLPQHPQQPIYGVLEEENGPPQDIYEPSPDYTKIGNLQPIYGELELEAEVENIYNQPEDEQPVYGEIEGAGDEPDYKTVDEIYINNIDVTDDGLINEGDDNSLGTLDKPKLAPKPKFIPPMSPPIRHKMANGHIERNQGLPETVS